MNNDFRHFADTLITFTTIGQRKPIISLRKNAQNLFCPMQTIEASLFTESTDDFLFELVHTPTLTNPNWVSAPQGVCQYDVTATAATGGRVIYSNYLRGATSASSVASTELNKVTRDFNLGAELNGTSDIISLVATNITLNATIYGVLNYRERT